MSKSQETFSKKEKEKKKIKKRQEKQLKKEARRENSSGGGLENMLTYVDEFGRFTDVPPEEREKIEIEAEDIEIGHPKKEDEEDVPNEGKISYFNHEKGYGFIEDKSSRDKYFFHISDCGFDPDMNQKVTFDLMKGQRGLNAVKIMLIG